MTVTTTGTVDQVFHQSEGLYDLNDPSPTSGIIPLQQVASDPSLPTLDSTTGLITPDQATASRLAHFPEDLYDLSPASHLTRFLRALMGDSGAGQLRKRYTVTRFETTLTGTHFYDLDGFYGAIFGATRNVAEQLSVNPMSSTATPEEWDEISSSDASFQDRITTLARAIALGATIPGLQAAAEALTGVECDVYETWQILDLYGTATAGLTWDQAEALYGSYDAIEAAGETWDSFTGEIIVGQSGSRSEIVIRPKKDYTQTVGGGAAFREAERVRLEDERSIQRVLNVLKPAGVIISVDNQGVILHIPTPIANLVSDSDYWEVLTKVQPNPSLVLNSNPYPVSPVRVGIAQIDDDSTLRPLPVPPFVDNVGLAWSYNAQITSVTGYAQKFAGAVDLSKTPGAGVDISNRDFEAVPQPGGGNVSYTPAKGTLDVRAIAAAQASADNALQAHPYSGPRVVVPGA